MRLKAMVVVLAFVLGMAISAWAAAVMPGYVDMGMFRRSHGQFQNGYVAGASDMNDALIARRMTRDTAALMLCLQEFTDTRLIGNLAEWLKTVKESSDVQAADAMLTNAPCKR